MCNCSGCCDRGPQGPVGYGFSVGNGAPSGAPVDNQVYYLDLDSSTIYNWNGTAWVSLGTLVSNSNVFNVTSPIDAVGDPYTNVPVAGTASSTTVVGDLLFYADRIGYTGDITLEITSLDGITFPSASTTFTMPDGRSTVLVDMEHATGLGAGAYTATIAWKAGATTVRTQNITFNLS